MKQPLFSLGLLVFALVAWSGCDSGQYGQEAETEPKAESEPMATAEAPPADEMAMAESEPMATAEAPTADEMVKVEGALMAPEEAAGASDNAEGVNHFQQGHWDVAQEHFNKALAANANLVEGHYNLALVLDKMGNHGEATNHFKKALELAPEDPRIKDSGILNAHVSG